MGTFDEFNKKEKPVFTGSRFGFGAGAAAPLVLVFLLWLSGGTKYTYNSKTIHVFTSTEPFICPKNITAEVFVVGGGGGGATDMAGGGGAGGVRNLSSVPISPLESMLSQLVLVVMEQDKIVLLILEQHLDKEMILVSEV